MWAIEREFRKLRNRLFKAFYGGEGCSCTYCGKSYRKFLHQGVRAEVTKKHRISGAGYMKNVRCPNCGSNQRMRLLYLFFDLRTAIYERDVRILHVVPKKDLARVLLTHDNIDYVCGDLFPERRAEFDAVKVNITDIGFPDAEFDVVICNHVLEHVPEDKVAMGEMFRVLKPGGVAYMTGALTAAQTDHIYEFRFESELVQMAEQNGLRVLETHSSGPSRTLMNAQFLPRSMSLIMQRREHATW